MDAAHIGKKAFCRRFFCLVLLSLFISGSSIFIIQFNGFKDLSVSQDQGSSFLNSSIVQAKKRKQKGRKGKKGRKNRGDCESFECLDDQGGGGERPEGGMDPGFKSITSCNDKQIVFDRLPVDLENVETIIPLGNFNPGAGHVFPTRHMYFHIVREVEGDHNSDTISTPLYAPADITFTRISSSENTSTQSTDYSLYFRPCREFKGYFLHVTSIRGALKNAFDNDKGKRCEEYVTGGTLYRNCSADFTLEVNKGEVIGTAGSNGRNALDFGAIDNRIEKHNFTSKLWKDDEMSNIVCPLDRYPDDLKASLYAKLDRTVAPLCGEVNYDVLGTASGMWFVPNTNYQYPEDPHLTLATDNLNPLRAAMSIGTSLPDLRSETFYFDPIDTGLVNRAFLDVSNDGNIYCYEVEERFAHESEAKRVFLLQLISDTRLKIENKGLGICSSIPQSFGSNAVEFER